MKWLCISCQCQFEANGIGNKEDSTVTNVWCFDVLACKVLYNDQLGKYDNDTLINDK